jgi:hypothetical protein
LNLDFSLVISQYQVAETLRNIWLLVLNDLDFMPDDGQRQAKSPNWTLLMVGVPQFS